MATMTTTEIGSIVYGLVSNIPTGVSGLMTILANNSIYSIENYTGTGISISSVAEAYQPAAINLTISNVLGLMEAQGIGTKSVTIGELSINKGQVDNTSLAYKNLAFSQLNDLGQKISFYQCWG